MDVILLTKSKQCLVNVSYNGKVSDLQQCVATNLKVPFGLQKLIHKGIVISKTPEKLLSEFGIKEKSKILVIGRPSNPEEDNILKKLKDIEKTVDKTVVTLEEAIEQLDSVLKGFNEESKAEILKHLKKQFMQVSFSLVKQIESIDAIHIEGDFARARQMRKSLIVKIQQQLEKCDEYSEKDIY